MTPGQELDWQPLEISIDGLANELAQLRDRCPVPRAELPGLFGFWSLLRYEDVIKAARDPATFSNSSTRLSIRRVPLESDPPEHTRIRRLLQPYFMPAVIAGLEPMTRQYALELIEPMIAAGRCDAVAAVAAPLPAQVLLSFIGRPRNDWRQIKQLAEQVYLQMSADAADQARFRAADEALWSYSRSVVEERRSQLGDPKTDMLSGMLSAKIDDEPIDLNLVVGTVRLLLGAGHDSTTSSLGICLHYLARNPADQTTLREHPDMIGTAIEEILRFESPVIMMPRTVSKDGEIRGRTLHKGDRLMFNWASANRDPKVFSQADQCLIARQPNRHLVFGHGIHSCLGAALARQEIRVALEELLRRSYRFELDGSVRYHGWHRYAPIYLPLKIVPKRDSVEGPA
jgi:cytochrome P450 family 130